MISRLLERLGLHRLALGHVADLLAKLDRRRARELRLPRCGGVDVARGTRCGRGRGARERRGGGPRAFCWRDASLRSSSVILRAARAFSFSPALAPSSRAVCSAAASSASASAVASCCCSEARAVSIAKSRCRYLRRDEGGDERSASAGTCLIGKMRTASRGAPSARRRGSCTARPPPSASSCCCAPTAPTSSSARCRSAARPPAKLVRRDDHSDEWDGGRGDHDISAHISGDLAPASSPPRAPRTPP